MFLVLPITISFLVYQMELVFVLPMYTPLNKLQQEIPVRKQHTPKVWLLLSPMTKIMFSSLLFAKIFKCVKYVHLILANYARAEG